MRGSPVAYVLCAELLGSGSAFQPGAGKPYEGIARHKFPGDPAVESREIQPRNPSIESIGNLPVAVDQKLRGVDPGKASNPILRQAFALQASPGKRRVDLNVVALSLKLARQFKVMEDTIRCLDDMHVGAGRGSFVALAVGLL